MSTGARHPSIAIDGAGPAALTAARLLAGSGFDVRLAEPTPSGPTLLLNPGALNLLMGLWGAAARALPIRHEVRWREVWPQPPETSAVVEQRSVVIDAAALAYFLDDVLRECGLSVVRGAPTTNEDWRLVATTRARDVIVGAARAAMAPVRTTGDFKADRVVYEAIEGGWVFLMPLGSEQALVQALAETPGADAAILSDALAASTRVSRLIDTQTGPIRVFDAAPAMARPASGPGWLAIGDAAMALPPATGDGVTSGLRTAILATAVLRGVHRGAPVDALLRHYDSRLAEAFRRVLDRTGHDAAISDTAASDAPAQPAFRLSGLDLIPIAA